MKYGYFDDENKEYVITAPKTPYPWINYLGSQDFFSLISNTAGGYSFYKDSLFRRITRYRYNNVPLDSGGRYFYIRDGDTIWNPGWSPVKNNLDLYECRHGLGYTRIKGMKNGLSAELLFFVPINYNGEVQQLTLKNSSTKKKSVHLFSFIEFCLWNAQDDMTNFQRNLNTGEVEVESSVVYHKTEYRERRNHFSFYSVNTDIVGFDTDRESFFGLYNGFDTPDVVLKGRSGNSIADGWSPVASHHMEVVLEPDGEKTFIFLLGYVENEVDTKWEKHNVIRKERALRMIDRFKNTKDIAVGFQELNEHWEGPLSVFHLQSSDERLNRMVNIWNQYQCMVTFNLARSASYFESGISRGIGFRDTNQDLLGSVHQVPVKVKQRILDVAATQRTDGSAYHQYQPLMKRGNDAIGRNFNDDPLWLILAVSAYIKETGDWKILDCIVPFENDTTKAENLFEHLRSAFSHVVHNRGPHDLPLIGKADWNDCMNLNCFSTDPDESFQTHAIREGKVAESVMIAGMFVYVGKEYAEMCRRTGKNEESEKAEEYIYAMEKAVIEHGWDEEWYLRAYDDAGEKVGSRECREGKIFIEPQGFCSMAGIGINKGFPEKALDSVKKYLSTSYGIVLLHPVYTSYYLNLGEVSSYPPGYKENAGIFCHANPWVMIGETVVGRGERAFDYYKTICPAYLEEISEIHKTEPYVYAQMIAGKDSKRHGEAKNSWLTGTAAWNFVAVTQWILGIRPDYDGLVIDPCIPRDWERFSVVRKFRNATYNIEVKNPNGISKGILSITVDGKKIEGNTLPLHKDGKKHTVTVVMGT